MKMYLAGPMRGYPLYNFPAFDKASKDLAENMGWDVISPADIDRSIGFDPETPEFTDEQWHDAMRRDYDAILNCDGIVFLPGWENSKGANFERRFGIQLGLPMYRYEPSNGFARKEMIIGLSGFAQSGKDTLAKQMRSLGFERRALADPMRNILYSMDPSFPAKDGSCISVKEAVDALGWERAKVAFPDIRKFLQRLGTEGGRDNLHEDVWVDAVLGGSHPLLLVISDVRFPNEVQAIRSRGGKVIRIERPGVGPVNSHISDNALGGCEFDGTIINDGEPEDMLKAVVDFLR